MDTKSFWFCFTTTCSCEASVFLMRAKAFGVGIASSVSSHACWYILIGY